MKSDRIPRSELRSYTLTRSGHFEAAHRLPGYLGKCVNLHGHRWEVTATVDFPIIPRELVAPDDRDIDGILVDFHDIDELWAEYDHTVLNEFIPVPSCEVIANILLEALCDLVEESLGGHNLPFNATIILFESPNSSVEVSVYQPTFIPTECDWMERDEGGCAGDRLRQQLRECECGCGDPHPIKSEQTIGTVEEGATVVGVSL